MTSKLVALLKFTVPTVVAASWYKHDVMELMTETLSRGGTANLSDAFTINGQPGDLYPCSKGTGSRRLFCCLHLKLNADLVLFVFVISFVHLFSLSEKETWV